MSVPSTALHPSSPAVAAPPDVDAGDRDIERARVRSRRRLQVQFLRIALAVVVIGGWEIATRLDWVDSFFFGMPSGIGAQLVKWFQNGTAQGPLWEQILVTLEETVLGFLIGVVLGVIFGVILGRNRLLADVSGPYIKGMNALPRVVLGSIFVISFGLGMQSKVALAVVLVFFVVFFNAFQGVREVDRNLLNNARILGASERQISTSVILPSALSWIIASLHDSAGGRHHRARRQTNNRCRCPDNRRGGRDDRSGCRDYRCQASRCRRPRQAVDHGRRHGQADLPVQQADRVARLFQG